MKTTRDFTANGSRYAYDFGLCSINKGFAQVDTWQDASYFGIWANPFRLIVFTYCEGDCTCEQCESEQEFCDLLHQIKKFHIEHGEEQGFRGIDCGCREDVAARFRSLGLTTLLYAEDQQERKVKL